MYPYTYVIPGTKERIYFIHKKDTYKDNITQSIHMVNMKHTFLLPIPFIFVWAKNCIKFPVHYTPSFYINNLQFPSAIILTWPLYLLISLT